MGFTRERVDRNGKVRYMAVYRDLKGRVRSAGTYTTERRADKEWQAKEAKLAEGYVGDPARGRMRFKRYVEEAWLPNHVMEAKTRENYTYAINKHIFPEFGSMRMIDIMPEHVRAWIAKQNTKGAQPPTIRQNKIILSAIFTTALNDQVIWLHPCRGVKIPPVPRKLLVVITPEQFDAAYRALPGADVQLLVETEIETGLRWGELTELRVRDLDFGSRVLTVSRAVVEVNPKHHPKGKRFLAKDYPKDKEYRRFRLSAQIVEKLQSHAGTKGLGADDLLFSMHRTAVDRGPIVIPAHPDDLELTGLNEFGRQYRHGTLSGYNAGKCRHRCCKAAYALYRSERRYQGKDNPRPPRKRRQTDEDGHISSDWFRRQIWYPAVEAAGLKIAVRVHDLRHAHASWLLAGGADLQVVKERLGHASITTTERYLHTLPDTDDTALNALSSIRNRANKDQVTIQSDLELTPQQPSDPQGVAG